MRAAGRGSSVGPSAQRPHENIVLWLSWSWRARSWWCGCRGGNGSWPYTATSGFRFRASCMRRWKLVPTSPCSVRRSRFHQGPPYRTTESGGTPGLAAASWRCGSRGGGRPSGSTCTRRRHYPGDLGGCWSRWPIRKPPRRTSWPPRMRSGELRRSARRGQYGWVQVRPGRPIAAADKEEWWTQSVAGVMTWCPARAAVNTSRHCRGAR